MELRTAFFLASDEDFNRWAQLAPEDLSCQRPGADRFASQALSAEAAVAVVTVPDPLGSTAALVEQLARAGVPVLGLLSEAVSLVAAEAVMEAGACQLLRLPLEQDDFHLSLLLADRWWRHWHRQQQALSQRPEMHGAYREVLRALGSALDTRDPETQEHATRVVAYAVKLGQALGMTEEELGALERGATLHDVGKIGVPDGILMKPARLSDAEWYCMRSHPEIGFDMLCNITFLADALPVVRHHHESYDGSGYPDGLHGEEIPLAARIFSVVDAFDAMTSDRPYRRALAPEEAVAELHRCAGSQFDPRVVETLMNLVDSGNWSSESDQGAT